MFPEASIVIPLAQSLLEPPSFFAQIAFPLASYFVKKASLPPELLNVVLPKVMVGAVNDPHIYKFPEASVATELPELPLSFPPSLFAHNTLPFASYFTR